MHQCAHPHARATWQAEQMVRDAPPGRATATAGATGGGGGGGRRRGGAPTHTVAGRPRRAGEGRHESGTSLGIERRCAAARRMPARGCSHAAPQASPRPAKDAAVVAACWCGWMRRCAASCELQAIGEAARRRLAEVARALSVHMLSVRWCDSWPLLYCWHQYIVGCVCVC